MIDIGVEQGVETIDHKFDLQIQYLEIYLVLDLKISLHRSVERVRNSRQGPVKHQNQQTYQHVPVVHFGVALNLAEIEEGA